MNELTVKVSVGEVLDKLTILSIKKERIKDNHKLIHVNREYSELFEKAGHFLNDLDVLQAYNELYSVNSRLWEIEDEIRELEKRNTFDDTFIEIARSVYKTNDLRFFYKNKLNELTNSTFKEQKGYC